MIIKDLNKFFSPKSIAIVGASPKGGKLGYVLAENIRSGGWKGKLYFVNPKYSRNRREYFANLAEIKKPVDLVLIVIPAPLVGGALENGAAARPKIANFAIISSGFKEAGKEGKIFEENLADIAKKHNLNILGPNCLGFTNQKEKLNATFTNVKLQKRDLAIVSQSGALAVALLDWAENKKIGFSKIISIGNKTILDESAILNFLEKDKNTKAIALYLEDIKHGREFMESAAKITPKKPVIILKAGKTSAGQKAISSHTGSLAQDEEIIQAVFDKSNIISANNIEEFQDIACYLNSNPVPAKKEVIILTNAGGPGVMASDFTGKSESIRLLDFPVDFRREIKKNLPASASVENPIDVIGDAPPERYEKTLKIIAAKFPHNPVITILTPQNQSDPGKVAQILANCKKRIPNISACFMGGKKISRAVEILEKNSIPNFDNPERALAVIEKMVRYKSRRDALNASPAKTRRPQYVSVINPIIRKVLSEKRKMLFWDEAEKLFAKHGVKLAKSISSENFDGFKNPPKARLATGGKKLSFPCVLKTDDPNIAHRLEKNAVALNIQNEAELRGAFGKIKKTTGVKRFLVQPMAAPGLEIIIGMKRDALFGPVVLCGWGGSFTEIFKDKIVLIPPFDQSELKSRLSQLAIFPILKGFRGKKGYNLAEISKIAAAAADLALENPRIREIDINPLVVYNDGKEGQILDAKIFLS